MSDACKELTKGEREELKGLEAKATRAPWEIACYTIMGGSGRCIQDAPLGIDFTLIVADRNAVLPLIHQVERLEGEIAKMKEECERANTFAWKLTGEKAALAKALDEIDAAAEAYQSDESETYPHKVMGMIVSSAYVLAQVAKQEGK
jgi:hypothetical protein